MTKVAKLVEHWVDQQFALLMEIFVSNVTVKEIKMLSLIQVIKQPILTIKLESMGGLMWGDFDFTAFVFFIPLQ